MFVFGIVGALLGALFGFPEIRARFAVDFSRLGDLFTLLYSGLLATTLVAGPVIDRFGPRVLLTIASGVVGAGFTIFATGSGYTAAALAAVAIGVGGGGLNIATNALVSALYPEDRGRWLNYLGAFFGVGALFVPVAASSLGSAASVPVVLLAAAAIAASLALAYAALPLPATEAGHHAFSIRDIPSAVAQPGVWMFAALLFFQTGNEAMVSGWVSTYIEQAGWPARTATTVLAAYWVAVIVGRATVGRLHRAVAGQRMLVVCGLISMAGCAWLMGARSIASLTAAALLTSLALSGVYPTTLALAGDRYRQRAGTVFGTLFSIGGIGGMVMPPILGRVSEAAGLRVGMGVPVAGAAAVTVLALVVATRAATRKAGVGGS